MLRLVAVICILASLGCESVLDPSVAPAAYALRSSARPAVLQNSSVRIEVLSDTLWLREDGNARRVVQESFDFAAGPDTTLTHEEPYRYERRGNVIEFDLVCPPNALCSPPPHLWGKFTPEGLELRSAVDPRTLLRYGRVRS